MATIEEAFDVVSKTFGISALNAPQKNGITKIVEEGRDFFQFSYWFWEIASLSSVIKPHEATVVTIRSLPSANNVIIFSLFG